MGRELKTSLGIVMLVSAMMVISSSYATSLFVNGSEHESDYYFVEFNQMPEQDLRDSLGQYGLDFHEYYQDNTFLEHIDKGMMRELTRLDCVESVTRYSAEHKCSREMLGNAEPASFKVIAHEDIDMEALVNSLEDIGISEIEVLPEGTGAVECFADASGLVRIAELEEVLSIERALDPIICMDLITSNDYMGHDSAQIGGFDGTGVLAEVQDDGIEITHPDLTQVAYTDGTTSVAAHGTCTSGIVFGTGAGDSQAQGIAYGATGAFCFMGTGRALSIQNLWNGDFNEGTAGMNGVVQSNSWAAAILDGEYMSTTNELDEAANNYPYLLTFWAAANTNSGTAEGLISQDSVAKNVVCVGGVFHNDTADLDDDKWMEKSERSCASRGPAADGRQKPDLCGPYDLIYTIDQQGSAGYDTGDYFFNFGGTSGATPTVSGAGILVYDMYQENHFGNNIAGNWPYSSTVKAMMIADAHQYDLSKATRNEQGWGTPDVQRTYEYGSDYHTIYEYPQALSSGDSWTDSIYSDGTVPLKITLAWNDPAAPSNTGSSRALYNNLDLIITSPSSTVYYGNNGLWDNLWSTSGTGLNHWGADHRDDLNNLENVFIQNPEIGEWTVEVLGRTGDIASGPQDFSLVASGARTAPGADGEVEILEEKIVPGDSITIQVWDSDLNQDSGTAETVSFDLLCNGEPAGESFILTEQNLDSGIFTGTVSIGLVDSAGTLCVLTTDTIIAEYYDASQTLTLSDTCDVDGAAPGTPEPMTVERWGDVSNLEYAASTEYALAWVFNDENHTYDQDDVYHFMQEIPTGSGSRLNLDITYTILLDENSVAPYYVYLDAFTTGEEFTVSYSLNGSAFTDIGTVTATSDTDTYSQWAISAAPLSTLEIHFIGTAQNNEEYDWLYVDHLYVAGTPTRATVDQNTLNWTLSADDGAGADDVVQYNIYRASSSLGPWDAGALIASVPYGTSSYTDYGKGEADGIIWYYVVRAEDIMGNEDTNTNAIPEPGASALNPFDIPISSGLGAGDWAFISFPYPATGNVGDILNDGTYGDGQTTWDMAKWYDPQDAADPWKSYSTLMPALSDMPQITESMGIWIRLLTHGGDNVLTTGFTGDYSGIPIDINLYSGWNLVGYPSATQNAADAALAGTGADMIAVYQAAAPYVADTTNLASVTMSEGNAYWVHVGADTVWTVNP